MPVPIDAPTLDVAGPVPGEAARPRGPTTEHDAAMLPFLQRLSGRRRHARRCCPSWQGGGLCASGGSSAPSEGQQTELEAAGIRETRAEMRVEGDETEGGAALERGASGNQVAGRGGKMAPGWKEQEYQRYHHPGYHAPSRHRQCHLPRHYRYHHRRHRRRCRECPHDCNHHHQRYELERQDRREEDDPCRVAADEGPAILRATGEPCALSGCATTSPVPRRCKIPSYLTTLLIISYTILGVADACSSRSTPKPRPPSPTPRPNITFHMYECPPDYAEWYCLNGATCFTVKIVDSLLYNCLCANGYIGQRCEFKDLDGSYLPSRQRVMLETASIAGGATIAVFLVVIICIAAYIHCKRKQKELRTSTCVDAVDGPSRDPELRPFSSRSRSFTMFMAKSSKNAAPSPSIEQTRMPAWNYPHSESTRMSSINESRHSSQ
ncbi:uncharacterized protein LOC105703122 isoform X2 [Orussus abietinus]|uniref:uncharacterized protein LOC105703122 isoform X2 n=1 Tax=Orussus abietinus TaxID=222816 RepID=UPI000626C78E|nr:uncharacterized protein LOC105703122 isoform X2 [Orussus abietinus]